LFLSAIEEFLEHLGRAVAPSKARGEGRAGEGPRRTDTEAGWLETWTRAENMIRELAPRGLTVDELAEAVHVSPTQLRRLFHAARGLSPKQALTAWRIEEAGRLLALGKWSVREVAAKVGFSSLPRFSAAFKKATGQPPSTVMRTG